MHDIELRQSCNRFAFVVCLLCRRSLRVSFALWELTPWRPAGTCVTHGVLFSFSSAGVVIIILLVDNDHDLVILLLLVGVDDVLVTQFESSSFHLDDSIDCPIESSSFPLDGVREDRP